MPVLVVTSSKYSNITIAVLLPVAIVVQLLLLLLLLLLLGGITSMTFEAGLLPFSVPPAQFCPSLPALDQAPYQYPRDSLLAF